MLYRFLKIVLGPLMKLLYQPWIRGAENIPEEGPAILASNHMAVIDSFFLPLMIDREVVFMGKSDYFTGQGLKGRLVAAFMRGVGTIPVDRTGGKKSLAALQTGLRRLEEGGLFGIYPEGTRSPDGRLHRGKTGVARLALESGAPVIPVAMIDTNIAQPIGVKIPRLHRIGVVVGEPLDFSRYQGLKGDRFVLRSITDEIMYNLMCLSGQEYVDRYAADVKKELAEQGKFSGPIPGGAKSRASSTQDDEDARNTDTPEEHDDAVHAPGGRPVPDVEVPTPDSDSAQPDHADNAPPASDDFTDENVKNDDSTPSTQSHWPGLTHAQTSTDEELPEGEQEVSQRKKTETKHRFAPRRSRRQT